MNKKTAGFVFLSICVVLAIFLLAHSITPIIGGALFALALVILGVLSKGFRRE
jgi:Flp pilus assembly protein TadB